MLAKYDVWDVFNRSNIYPGLCHNNGSADWDSIIMLPPCIACQHSYVVETSQRLLFYVKAEIFDLPPGRSHQVVDHLTLLDLDDNLFLFFDKNCWAAGDSWQGRYQSLQSRHRWPDLDSNPDKYDISNPNQAEDLRLIPSPRKIRGLMGKHDISWNNRSLMEVGKGFQSLIYNTSAI